MREGTQFNEAPRASPWSSGAVDEIVSPEIETGQETTVLRERIYQIQKERQEIGKKADVENRIAAGASPQEIREADNRKLKELYEEHYKIINNPNLTMDDIREAEERATQEWIESYRQEVLREIRH